ncbi:MAG: sulfite exporter TauE/SafE family protein [Clostridia bacterium]|nr:sulfite exporter TauE/SafE family protein [Clostridia bacterium]
MIFWEIVAGIIGGIVAGMGMGGGTLTIPILTIFLKYEQLRAQGVNLVAFLPMAVVALFIHVKNKLVDFKSTWLLALIGCVFSLGGALIANHISNSILKKLFALFLIGLGIWQFIELKKNKKN